MISREGVVEDQVVKVEFIIRSGRYDDSLRVEAINAPAIFLEEEAKRLLFHFGYIEIKGVEVRKL